MYKPTLEITEAAQLLGVSRATLYRSVAANAAPCPVVKIGSRVVVPTKPLLDILGLDELPDMSQFEDKES